MGDKLILVTGGARSGKSSFAEQLCKRYYDDAEMAVDKSSEKNCKIAYIATAQIFDEEMKERVRLHRQRRASYWHTFESPTNVVDVLSTISNVEDKVVFTSVLVDCLTVLTTNVFLSTDIDWDKPSDDELEVVKNKVFEEIDNLLTMAEKLAIPVVMVTNELGMGIVPENKMARIFRDIAGWVNQRVAARANKVYLVVSGIPMCIKDEC